MKLFFWDYWFSYVFIRYQKWGQEASAHFFAMCVMGFLSACNVLAILTLLLPKTYLDSKPFEKLLIIITGLLFSLNGLMFLANRRYLKIVSEYHTADLKKISKMKRYFWIYLCATVILSIIAFSF